MTSIERVDGLLALYVNRPAGRDQLLDTLVFDISDSIILKGGLFLAFYWWLWFQSGDYRFDVRRTIVASLVGGVTIAVIARLLQLSGTFHQRPLHSPSLGLRLPLSVNPNTLNDWSSFPSDHAVLFFALCVPMWSWSRRLGVVAGLWTLIVICLPRVYLGYHYPSDILAGAVIGVVLMVAIRGLLLRTAFPDRVVHWASAHPAVFSAVAFLLTLELAVLFFDLRRFGVVAARLVKILIV